MAFKIKIDAIAETHINEAIEYYENRQEGLGLRFYLHLDSYFESLKTEVPAFQSIETTNFKQLPLSKFPYVIVYMVRNKAIYVMSVFNTHQHPDKKLER